MSSGEAMTVLDAVQGLPPEGKVQAVVQDPGASFKTPDRNLADFFHEAVGDLGRIVRGFFPPHDFRRWE